MKCSSQAVDYRIAGSDYMGLCVQHLEYKKAIVRSQFLAGWREVVAVTDRRIGREQLASSILNASARTIAAT